MPKEKLNRKPKIMKKMKKSKSARCSFSIFIEIKCLRKSRAYETLALKWKKMSEDKKIPFKVLADFDKERASFEKDVFNRFELILRLFSAASNSKLIQKCKAISIYKEELKASLIERGFSKLPNLEILGRRKFSKMDKESKLKYKTLAKTKTEEAIEQVFARVANKANIYFGDMLSLPGSSNSLGNLFDEDYDEFIMDNNYNI